MHTFSTTMCGHLAALRLHLMMARKAIDNDIVLNSILLATTDKLAPFYVRYNVPEAEEVPLEGADRHMHLLRDALLASDCYAQTQKLDIPLAVELHTASSRLESFFADLDCLVAQPAPCRMSMLAYAKRSLGNLLLGHVRTAHVA